MAGCAVVVVGVILLPLPGPGMLVILAGLGILATEFEWADRLLARGKSYAAAQAERAKQRLQERRRPRRGGSDIR